MATWWKRFATTRDRHYRKVRGIIADITVGTVATTATTTSDSGTAGETITHGQTLYKNTADSNRLYKAGALVLAQAQVVGAALHGAVVGEPIKYATGGDLAITTLVAGTVYVQSATSGAICPCADLDASTATNYATIIGVASSTSNLKLALRFSNVVNP